jgi:CheY-like chemotaxis protein
MLSKVIVFPLMGPFVADCEINMAFCCSQIGFEVLEAENGVKAIELFQSHRSTLRCVLLDLQMPVMDGWETAEKLRLIEADSQGTRMPIVACTALNLAEAWHEYDTVASSALQCGFDALLVSIFYGLPALRPETRII